MPRWGWPHALSLEAPAVAVLWLLAVARIHDIMLLPSIVLGLGLAAWSAYAADRLADSWGAEGELDERHEFCRRHRGWFLLLLAAAAAAAGWLALFAVPAGIVWLAAALAILVALYLLDFAIAGKRVMIGSAAAFAGMAGLFIITILPVPRCTGFFFSVIILMLMISGFLRRAGGKPSAAVPKEVFGSLLFTLGCVSSVHFFTVDQGGWNSIVEIAMLWSLILANMTGIAAVEKARGWPHESGSVKELWPHLAERHVMQLAAAFAMGMTVFFLSRNGTVARNLADEAVCIMASAALLTGLWAARGRLSPLAFRALADLAVVLPLPWIWWEK